MQVTAYRGVEYREALKVVARQAYTREERRSFAGGVRAKAVFGPGVYLVSDPLIAAQYACCHAETVWDRAAVLRQVVTFDSPRRLSQSNEENELRQEALQWAYTAEEIAHRAASMPPEEWLAWTGAQVRDYLTERGHDGIVYELPDGQAYYVCYHPGRQIREICLLYAFDVQP